MSRESERVVQILLDFGGALRQFVRFSVRDKDASLYIIPASVNNIFQGGIYSLGNGFGPFQTKIDFADAQSSVDEIPHVSIHQSGLVRAYSQGAFFGELQSTPPVFVVNDHIATIGVKSFKSLPTYEKEVNLDRKQLRYDEIFKVRPEDEGARFPIFVNGIFPQFMQECMVHIQMRRPGLVWPLSYCVAARKPPAATESVEQTFDHEGVVVIAGWDVNKIRVGEETNFLFLIGR